MIPDDDLVSESIARCFGGIVLSLVSNEVKASKN